MLKLCQNSGIVFKTICNFSQPNLSHSTNQLNKLVSKNKVIERLKVSQYRINYESKWLHIKKCQLECQTIQSSTLLLPKHVILKSNRLDTFFHTEHKGFIFVMSSSEERSFPKGKIKVEDFFEFPLKCFKFVGLNLIPSNNFSPRAKLQEKLLKVYYFFCIINIWMFIFTFGARVFVDIADIPVVIRVLPNLTNVPYNSSKSR